MSEHANGRYDFRLGVPASFFAWPFIAAAAAGDMLAEQAGQMARLLSPPVPDRERPPKVDWSAPNHVVLELSTMELRDFSSIHQGVPTLVCAPFALHGASIADLAPGHSLVEALARHGCPRVFVTDWRSATPDMRLFTIDTYLADLNVAVDEIGAPVDLVGLCQGGWLSLVYAARFPGKVRKLVLAGAPVDTEAAESSLSIAAHTVPLALVDEVARLGGGRVLGQRWADLWAAALQTGDATAILQLQPEDYGRQEMLQERFRRWSEATVDLPGAFYHQTVQWLFKENRLAGGRFTALGRRIDLAEVRQPMFLLAARDDEIVPPEQLLALRRLAGTQAVESMTEPGHHLSLFFGARTLQGAWARIARWLAQDSST
ncbi:alpha/beta fold hydrolase [Reyranella sp.]|uniref:alpha/beta fold hydrolase n=1 Tax=Reyranella sp. TaxID=1929291 RepID=UPI003D1150EA